METYQYIAATIILIAMIAYILKPEIQFICLAHTYYRKQAASGKIRKPMQPSDFIDEVSDELLQLDDKFKEYDFDAMSPRAWTAARQNMAGIILAITNMAIYYDVDIMKEIEIKIHKHE